MPLDFAVTLVGQHISYYSSEDILTLSISYTDYLNK